jgi:hypothetical protein
MGVLRDFKCDTHGYFESMEDAPNCPMKGCHADVYVVFLQAPGLVSEKTKKNDKNIKQLAIDFDMSNIKSTREGENQAGFYTRKNKTSKKDLEREAAAVAEQKREPRPGDAVMWGGAGRMNMSSLLRGNMFKSVAGESVGINPKAVAGDLTGPKAASYIADHENLAIKK